MAKTRRNFQTKPIRNIMETKAEPIGKNQNSSPSTNRGVKVHKEPLMDAHQSGPDRFRVNVSLPAGVHGVLSEAADVFGTSMSQVALMLVMDGLPGLAARVSAVKSNRGVL